MERPRINLNPGGTGTSQDPSDAEMTECTLTVSFFFFRISARSGSLCWHRTACTGMIRDVGCFADKPPTYSSPESVCAGGCSPWPPSSLRLSIPAKEGGAVEVASHRFFRRYQRLSCTMLPLLASGVEYTCSFPPYVSRLRTHATASHKHAYLEHDSGHCLSRHRSWFSDCIVPEARVSQPKLQFGAGHASALLPQGTSH